MRSKGKLFVTVAVILLCIGFARPMRVYAADTSVTFVLNGYEREAAETLPTGMGTTIFFNIYVVIVLAIIALVVIVELIIFSVMRLLQGTKGKHDKQPKRTDKKDYRDNNREKDNNGDKSSRADREEITIIDLDDEDTWRWYSYGIGRENHSDVRQDINEEETYGGQIPVIHIEDVTMEFHLAGSATRRLWDRLIQILKREISYRKLYALYHVSFNVYKGEVVGIIGTNGSGKSTLLKIVSGALKPTGGRVEVDRKKIQLLTLGTGFDMELTARENVYLNGSIIGYSREFLDMHYEEIVEFAELSGFMEEKVKNFSSGMVSRLGFAIATAGDAAEILILDEVLSVGDVFFRKKSLKRVKEMIHGGSTVLLVSHGMETIIDNCTKAVWIEKGKLMMVGEPKKVCDAYRKSGVAG